MDILTGLIEPLFGLIFMGMQVGFAPALITYFVAKTRLRDGSLRSRAWKPALAGAILLCITIASAWIFDIETVAAIFLVTFFASSTLFGVAVGIAFARDSFKRNAPDAASAK